MQKSTIIGKIGLYFGTFIKKKCFYLIFNLFLWDPNAILKEVKRKYEKGNKKVPQVQKSSKNIKNDPKW